MASVLDGSKREVSEASRLPGNFPIDEPITQRLIAERLLRCPLELESHTLIADLHHDNGAPKVTKFTCWS